MARRWPTRSRTPGKRVRAALLLASYRAVGGESPGHRRCRRRGRDRAHLLAGPRRSALHGRRRPPPRPSHHPPRASTSPPPPGPATCWCRWPRGCSPAAADAAGASRRRARPDGGRAVPGRRDRGHGRRAVAGPRGGGPDARARRPDRGAPRQDRRAHPRGLHPRRASPAEAGPAEVAALTAYGEEIGLAFQIADDVLDATGTSEELGKTAGRDAAAGQVHLRERAGRRRRARGGGAAGAAGGGAPRGGGGAERGVGGLAGYIVTRNS